MSYNGSGTFQINSSGQPVVTGTVISSTAFNALTADLATGLSTAITKDGQTTTTVRVPFAQGISSTLVTDATSATTGSIITAGGISTQKALWVGTTSTFAGTMTAAAATFSGTLGVTGAATFNGRITQSLTPSSAEYALRSTGQTTGWIAIDMTNTGGDYVIGGENSTGNNLIGGDSAYDMCIRGPSGIAFSANAGASQQMRLTSTGLLGIGMTPSNVLDITQTQNGTSAVQLLNSNASAAARADIRLLNGTSQMQLVMFGTGYTTSGIFRQDGTLLFGNGAGGVTIDTGAAQPIYFGINNAEKARFGTDGSFLVGLTTNAGAGCISATGNGTNAGVIVSTQSTTGGWCFSGTAVSNGGTYYYASYVGGTGGAISNNGTVTTYAATSDERMKDWDNVPQSNLRGKIDALWLGDFDIYNDFTKTGTPHRGFGVRAQQAYEVLGRQFGLGPPMTENDKWQAPSEPFGFLALWGVKDLYAENEALRARVAALEAKVN